MRKEFLLVSAAPLICALLASGAHGQAAPPASPSTAGANAAGDVLASPSSTSTVQEIIVTSTRRAVDLQQAAVTVEAVPAATLKSLNINSVYGLSDVVPGLVLTPSGGNNAYLRGVGSANTGYNEAQVAIYIDGLYLPNPAMSIYSFNNIDQVEVLKGPQGTLYGRNANGGLISVTTRDPGKTQRLDASIGYANYDTLTENFYGSTPLTDTLAVNLALYHSKQNQGWDVNLFTGSQDQKSDETGLQSKLVWRPSTATKVTADFIFDYNNRDFGYVFQQYPGTFATDGTPFLGKFRSSSRIDPSAPFYSYTGSIKVEQDLGFANLMSLTGYQNSYQTVNFSVAGGPGQPVAGQGNVLDRQFGRDRTYSEEFQLTSKASPGSRLDWVAGAFLYDDNTEIQLDTWTTCVGGICTPGYTPTRNAGYPTTVSYSGYGDATYRFFEATRLTVGLRYTDETKGLTGSVLPLAGFPDSVAALPPGTVTRPGQPYPGNPAGIPTNLHFDQLTYRLVLAQDFGHNIHAYVSDNLGFKSGAYNANLFTNPPALPETLQAYEVGVKSELFDRRLRLNVAYFYYDYNNIQVRSVAPPAPPGNVLLENAAKERQQGVDADFNIALTREFSINGGVEYLDSKYVNFPGTTCTTFTTKVVNGMVLGAPISVACNLAGFTTPDSPPASGTVGFVYKIDTAVGSWALSGSDHFNSRYPLAADGSIQQPPHNIVNASLSWTAARSDFDVQLFVRNLTNEYVYANGGTTIVPGAPRTFGVTVGYHF